MLLFSCSFVDLKNAILLFVINLLHGYKQKMLLWLIFLEWIYWINTKNTEFLRMYLYLLSCCEFLFYYDTIWCFDVIVICFKIWFFICIRLISMKYKFDSSAIVIKNVGFSKTNPIEILIPYELQWRTIKKKLKGPEIKVKKNINKIVLGWKSSCKTTEISAF